MNEHAFGWLSILPPLLAIILAVATRQVYISLFVGILAGALILSPTLLDSVFYFFQVIVDVFKDSGNTRVIIFVCLVGGLLELIERSGGYDGISNKLTLSSSLNSKRKSLLLIYVTGIIIFIESTITIIITGTLGKVLSQKFKISKEKIAYICDSTSAPVSILIPINAWGAFVLGLIEKQKIGDPLPIFLGSIFNNYYAIISLILVFFFIMTGKHFGPMKLAEKRAESGEGLQTSSAFEQVKLPTYGDQKKSINFILPVLVLMFGVPVFLFLNGYVSNQDPNASFFKILTSGSGSTAVLLAMATSILVIIGLTLYQKQTTFERLFSDMLEGSGKFINLGLLMILAFAIGQISVSLQTGEYMAGFIKQITHPGLIIAGVFLVSCLISFSTGTSWGTFAIMIPIAIPIATMLGLSYEFTIAAVLSGGIFGDHCSPISDSTIISSMAAGCDLMAHVRTQLPYALLAASITFVLFLFV